MISICGLSLRIPRSHVRRAMRTYRQIRGDNRLRDDGVSLVGYIGKTFGEAQVFNSVVSALSDSDVFHDVIDLDGNALPRFKNKITFTTSHYFKYPMYNNISVLYWEFESGMSQARPYAFDGAVAVITFSEFCANYFRSIAPSGTAIYKLNCPITIDTSVLKASTDVRRKYGISDGDFVCFFNFSYNSSYFRKNPDAVLRAFAAAFPTQPDVRLIIKTVGGDVNNPYALMFNDVIKSLNLSDRVIVIDGDLSDVELKSLIHASDVYISLHRGEGLGLGMLEAMLLSKPVIATNYGGNTDFMNSENSLLVDFALVKPEQNQIDLDAYRYVEYWASPNEKTASSYLVQLYAEPEFRVQLGKRARTDARKYTSRDKFVKQIKNIIKNFKPKEN